MKISVVLSRLYRTKLTGHLSVTNLCKIIIKGTLSAAVALARLRVDDNARKTKKNTTRKRTGGVSCPPLIVSFINLRM